MILNRQRIHVINPFQVQLINFDLQNTFYSLRNFPIINIVIILPLDKLYDFKNNYNDEIKSIIENKYDKIKLKIVIINGNTKPIRLKKLIKAKGKINNNEILNNLTKKFTKVYKCKKNTKYSMDEDIGYILANIFTERVHALLSQNLQGLNYFYTVYLDRNSGDHSYSWLNVKQYYLENYALEIPIDDNQLHSDLSVNINSRLTEKQTWSNYIYLFWLPVIIYTISLLVMMNNHIKHDKALLEKTINTNAPNLNILNQQINLINIIQDLYQLTPIRMPLNLPVIIGYWQIQSAISQVENNLVTRDIIPELTKQIQLALIKKNVSLGDKFIYYSLLDDLNKNNKEHYQHYLNAAIHLYIQRNTAASTKTLNYIVSKLPKNSLYLVKYGHLSNTLTANVNDEFFKSSKVKLIYSILTSYFFIQKDVYPQLKISLKTVVENNHFPAWFVYDNYQKFIKENYHKVQQEITDVLGYQSKLSDLSYNTFASYYQNQKDKVVKKFFSNLQYTKLTEDITFKNFTQMNSFIFQFLRQIYPTKKLNINNLKKLKLIEPKIAKYLLSCKNYQLKSNCSTQLRNLIDTVNAVKKNSPSSVHPFFEAYINKLGIYAFESKLNQLKQLYLNKVRSYYVDNLKGHYPLRTVQSKIKHDMEFRHFYEFYSYQGIIASFINSEITPFLRHTKQFSQLRFVKISEHLKNALQEYILPKTFNQLIPTFQITIKPHKLDSSIKQIQFTFANKTLSYHHGYHIRETINFAIRSESKPLTIRWSFFNGKYCKKTITGDWIFYQFINLGQLKKINPNLYVFNLTCQHHQASFYLSSATNISVSQLLKYSFPNSWFAIKSSMVKGM